MTATVRKPADIPFLDKLDLGDDGLGNFEEAQPTRSVIKPEYKKNHVPDDIGQTLSQLVTDDKGRVDMAKLKAFAEANGCWRERYASLNPGLARMNVGNRLRAKARKSAK